MALAAPAGTFFDYAPLHLITTGTLASFGAIAPSSAFDYRRFRPNMVIEVDGDSGYIENGWPGRRISIGEEVVLEIIDPTPRCVVTTLAQPGLPHDREILRTIAAHGSAISRTAAPGARLSAVAGVYATTLRGGGVGARARCEVRSAEEGGELRRDV